MDELIVPVVSSAAIQQVFGASDVHLRAIRRALSVQVTVDDQTGSLIVRGETESVRKAAKLFGQLQQLAKQDGVVATEDVERALSEIQLGGHVSAVKPLEVYGGIRVRPKTAGQAKYVHLLRRKDIVICTGPAGTGKTYLAVARAVEALKAADIKKIVLVRPAVEAGENLGFLPGSLQEKINPYLRPLFDSLADMVEPDILKRAMEEDRIEVIPLAYMRGRTLNHAYIILDEAQNTTTAQMKMFLTRMGEGSRIIVCGDTTQVDLPSNRQSGLTDALGRLQNIEEIATIQLSHTDIVRHKLVQKIVQAYDAESGVWKEPPM